MRWKRINICEAYESSRVDGVYDLWIREFPSPKLGWGGLEEDQERVRGWYWTTNKYVNGSDWKLIPNVTTMEEAQAVALMLYKLN